MAFDPTVSGADSNSYISVAAADAYFAFHLDGVQFWNSLPTVTKQAALVQATNRLDVETFSGRPTTNTQRLQFPRLYVLDRNYKDDRVVDASGNVYIDSDKIPRELADATCEMALHYLKVQAGEFTVDENDLETLQSMKIGPIDVSIKANIKADRLPTKVKTLLQAIGNKAWLGEAPLTFVR